MRACLLNRTALAFALLLGAWMPVFRGNAESNRNEAGPFWAFQPPQAGALPDVEAVDWPRMPLDTFVLAGVEARGWSPEAAADGATLLRRSTLLMTGLPPDEADRNVFFEDTSPNAYERHLDRLLASYRFGERMASFWLTIARYAEDQAHQVGSDTKYFYPNAYLYRQWVIDAFNGDLPYDKFIRYQLAADFDRDAESTQIEALGFLGLGPKYYNRNSLEVKADEWEDRVDTVTRSFLGLTVACARCHDHKYDPITTEDYHALAGVFASTDMHNLQEPKQGEGKRRDASEKVDGGDDDEDGDEKKKKDKRPPEDGIHIVKEGEVQDLPVFVRGNVERKGEIVKRRFLTVLSEGEPEPFHNGSGRRELAEAIADPENPLTSRIMVNRLWSIVFGAPIVATPSNFGKLGARPTHPELLDTLAVRFNEEWSCKKLLREMLSSAAFRQCSTTTDSVKLEEDPGNQTLARMNRIRLSVEMWRDTLLAAAGNLDPLGGQSLELHDPANHRRTVYGRVSRLELNEILAAFDYPDPNIHAARRYKTTTTTQKLFQLNHPLVLEQAEKLAAEVMAWEGPDDRRLDRVYRLLFVRGPTESETKRSLDFLRSGEVSDVNDGVADADRRRWAGLLQVLFCSNQMLFLD